jgi:hypothetical protein
MERGNTKHGPAQDEQLAHETTGMVRGATQRTHTEEWRETEPVGDSVPPITRRPPGRGQDRDRDRDVAERSALARVMTRDLFPADRDALLARLEDSDVPEDLAARVARLPSGRRFASAHDVLVALGISSPETR